MIQCTDNSIKIEIEHTSPCEELEHYRKGLFAILKAVCALDPIEFSSLRIEIHDTIVLLEHLSPSSGQVND
jgi:hypothetical protein